MSPLGALLSQPLVLLQQQIENQGRMTMDQRQETRPIQPEQLQRSQGPGIAAVIFGGFNEVFVKKQLTWSVAHAIARTTAEFDETALHNVDRLNRLTSPKHQRAGWKGESVPLRVLTDQLERCRLSAGSTQIQSATNDHFLLDNRFLNVSRSTQSQIDTLS